MTRAEELTALETYFDRLFPILRSITGAGVRATHDILGELVRLERFEVPSGTPAFDWTVPKEWAVKEAYIVTPSGERILDIRDNNLHLLNYSAPFRGRLSRRELDKHLHSLPEQPNAIPYLTTYYKERWGFCLTHAQRQSLAAGDYEVVIDTELKEGSLTLSEAVLPGESAEEILISTYTCHPSMANNELSGPLVAAFLYRRIAALENRRYTYRFVFLPETIGALVYLNRRGEQLKKNLVAGYVVTCIGDAGGFTYKRSKQHHSLADRAAEYALRDEAAEILDFSPFGSDERQYCSPGFNLPVGSLMRTMYGRYPEYHTSLDNKGFVSFTALQASVDVYEETLLTLEQNRRYLNLFPHGEPRLDKRGLYDSLGHSNVPDLTKTVLWLLSYSDGEHDLLDIAKRSEFSVAQLHAAAQRCVQVGLLEPL